MSERPPIPWQELFKRNGGEVVHVEFRVLHKAGLPFLLLPQNAKLAARALSLYPAQSTPARFAKIALRWALRTKLPLPLKTERIEIATDDPFVRFLKELAGAENPPPIAILPGNPRAPGRRFIVLVFDENQNPSAVVKAGVGEAAIALIEREKSFLASVPEEALGVPRLRASLDNTRVTAFALNFIEGSSPRAGQMAAHPLLASWIDTSRRMPLHELPVWQRLAASFPMPPSLQESVRETGNRRCHPALMHGDFAPWNVKVSREGAWMALDWDRGETAGVPGWDWFHFVVQSAVLIAREEPLRLARDVEIFLESEPLRAYAERAGITEFRRELLLAYLLYCSNVLMPTEGIDAIRLLLAELTTRWLL